MKPGRTPLVISVLLACSGFGYSQDSPLYAWVEQGSGNEALVRAIISGGDCPQIAINGSMQDMSLRSDSSLPGFEVKVCEYRMAKGTTSITLAGQSLPVPKSNPKRILVLGDTGCRIKGDDVQNCTGNGSGEPWSFDQVAAAAAKMKPDLIVHVGDYLYRETACPEGNAGCAGSPYGDNWPTWQVDFFQPSGSLLSAAPWVFVRGNHEDCSRSWKGWFLFLDPNPLPENIWDQCAVHPEPYAVDLGGESLIILDTSTIPDDYAAEPDPGAVTLFTKQLNTVNQLASENKKAWVATHRPFWGISPYISNGAEAVSTVDVTLQAALAKTELGAFPSNMAFALGGHIHLTEILDLQDGRPPQLVAGAGGTKMDPPLSEAFLAHHPEVFKSLDLTPSQFQSFRKFSFFLFEAKAKGWQSTLYDTSGKVLATYSNPGSGVGKIPAASQKAP